MDFFTDREQGKKAQTKNEISIEVWNGIVSTMETFLADNSLAKDFPEQCPDRLGVCGYDITLFYDRAKALIPDIEIPIQRRDFNPYNEEDNKINTFATLDLIEFIYSHIYEASPVGNIHEYFNHFHYRFENTGANRARFREEINTLFERNGIAYTLDENGKIQRVLPEVINNLIHSKIKTQDSTLDSLINESIENFLQPKVKNRKIGLEKLWDAFERIKTYHGAGNKQVSINQLLDEVAMGNKDYRDMLEAECQALTKIGNNFQIRHFERNKIEIVECEHIDYLYLRLYSIMNLFVTCIQKKGI